jgi:cardiolipin synthase
MNIVTTPPGSLGQPYRKALDDLRLERAFARIADSDLRHGNAMALLRDSRENYPAWLQAIRSAQTVVHFENFIIADDDTGREFADALMERAQAGVRVRVLYDWLGSSARALPHYWRRLREAGVQVKVFNPPRPVLDPSQPPQADHRRRSHRLRLGALHLRQLGRQGRP